MSADLTWLLVKDNSSFLVKRSGVQFTTEPNNLTNLNSFKYSGLANAKVVGVEANASGKGVVLTTKKQSVSSGKPGKSFQKVAISGSSRRAAKSIVNATARSGYRADLRKAALGRLSAILAAQKPKKVTKKAGRSTLRK
ncbi:putative ribosomal protein L28 [Basidiobolus meristosporus CBS 931.73]|uniref:Putative ribosomal protein L28 n=1 Tax=Basidiobolus meristosporus CBS 931.73 TaxID=1314790 RepID=A0A1Y1Z5T5_9FUNG|nr:putative ribosomal protein L28 [Basidiobolus meristosporus CBS 931.73]|eukprot:ORY05347.1 putative ribosomal protein L28 [Basidiobolus meristosporus CBS 931.73]